MLNGEWKGQLTRLDAIRIIENATDNPDPAWDWLVEDFYDEETDTMPSVYHVFSALGVSADEYKKATGAQNVNWPEQVQRQSTDDELIAQQARENAALQQQLKESRAAVTRARSRIICIGGPLNDNKLGYSKDQLVTFAQILNDLDGE